MILFLIHELFRQPNSPKKVNFFNQHDSSLDPTRKQRQFTLRDIYYFCDNLFSRDFSSPDAQQTEREQIKIPRFILKGPRLCTIQPFFFAQTLCMNNVSETLFLLVSFSREENTHRTIYRRQLYIVLSARLSLGQRQKGKQKYTEQRPLLASQVFGRVLLT